MPTTEFARSSRASLRRTTRSSLGLMGYWFTACSIRLRRPHQESELRLFVALRKRTLEARRPRREGTPMNRRQPQGYKAWKWDYEFPPPSRRLASSAVGHSTRIYQHTVACSAAPWQQVVTRVEEELGGLIAFIRYRQIEVTGRPNMVLDASRVCCQQRRMAILARSYKRASDLIIHRRYYWCLLAASLADCSAVEPSGRNSTLASSFGQCGYRLPSLCSSSTPSIRK